MPATFKDHPAVFLVDVDHLAVFYMVEVNHHAVFYMVDTVDVHFPAVFITPSFDRYSKFKKLKKI